MATQNIATLIVPNTGAALDIVHASAAADSRYMCLVYVGKTVKFSKKTDNYGGKDDLDITAGSKLTLNLTPRETALLENNNTRYELVEIGEDSQPTTLFTGTLNVQAPSKETATTIPIYVSGNIAVYDVPIEDVPATANVLVQDSTGNIYVNNAGVFTLLTPGYTTMTLAQMAEALEAESLIEGQYYVITDSYTDRPLVVFALSNSKLDTEAVVLATGVKYYYSLIAGIETFILPNEKTEELKNKTLNNAYNTITLNDGSVSYLKLTSKVQEYLKSMGFSSQDDLLIPHNWMTNNYAIIDKNGKAHMMVEIPRKNWDPTNQFASTEIDPAFIVNGVQKRIFVGKYQVSMDGANYVTRPNASVKTGLTFDQELAACGGLNGTGITGFHLMTNAEFALLSRMCKANNFMPYGNNNFGRDTDNKLITGVMEDPTVFGGSSGNGKWKSGSGGIMTSHNNDVSGIFDLNGNVWERVSGLRLNEGEIQILANNNAADYTKDQSSTSAEWKAILLDGSLVAPGTANTLKINGTSPNAIVQAITTQLVDPNSTAHTFETVTTALTGVGIDLLKKLGIMPYTTGLGGDYIYMRNYGEQIPLRGGYFYNAGSSGVYALVLSDTRLNAYSNIGFRLSFYL